MSAVSAGDKQEIERITKRYNHADLKAALKKETWDKCAYCEAKVTDVAYGDIEHVTPKSIARDRTFDWENLTFACQICNQMKSDKEGILDPYKEDPKKHIFFAGAFAKGRSKDGILTVLELRLNRNALIESRNREIERYADQIEKICQIVDIKIKKLMIESIFEEFDTGRPEFIAACRKIVLDHDFNFDVAEE